MKTKNLNGYFNIVGTNIAKYRKIKSLSQRQLADKLNLLGVNIYNSDISRIENHTLFIRDYEQKAICEILGITYDQLFEDTDHFYNIKEQLFKLPKNFGEQQSKDCLPTISIFQKFDYYSDNSHISVSVL